MPLKGASYFEMIGLYGGSFDPVHIGHLRIAEDIREYYNLDKIIFIPAYHSPLKPKSRASDKDRLKMLQLSIQHNPFFEIDDIELRKKGKSYTIYTVKEYKKRLGFFPFFIVGTDAFLTLDKWKDPEELINTTNFIVVGRDKDNLNSVKRFINEKFPEISIMLSNKLNPKVAKTVYYFDSRRIDVSSTEIRDRIRHGKSIKYLVLPEVEDYIFSKKLYRE